MFLARAILGLAVCWVLNGRKKGLQTGPAAGSRPGRRGLGLGRRGPPLSRRDGRTVVRQRRLRAPRDRGCRYSADDAATVLSADAVAWAGGPVGGAPQLAFAERTDPRVLRQ